MIPLITSSKRNKGTNMKFIAFEVKDYEKEHFKKVKPEIKCIKENLTIDNVELTKGFEGISILGHSLINREMLDLLKAHGVKYISTRTIGFDHIDFDYAKSLGIRVSRAYYDPHGVADYTVMLMLMCLRHYKQAMFRGNVNDYSLTGLQGKEMRNLTIGVIGTGNIGAQVIENIQGFGCKILGFDTQKNAKLENKITYVSLEELYKQSDIITLHIPLFESTKHLINKQSLQLMKNGIIIINCARGELINTEDIIDAIENRKVGALGLDVIENEKGIYHQDRRSDILENREMAYLRQFPNVVMTQHIAFFTYEAISMMVKTSVDSLLAFSNNNDCPFEIK